jgi:uncharacterized OB-fold protein
MIDKARQRSSIKKGLASKCVLEDYRKYLEWRGIIATEPPRRPGVGNISLSAAWRERKQNLAMYGSKCLECGTIHYPMQRICVSCQTPDHFDLIRLSDKRGEVFSYTADYLDPVESPHVTAVVDFEDGGRCILSVTDRVPEEVRVGMTVEMRFRRVLSERGIHNYFWKAAPLRD